MRNQLIRPNAGVVKSDGYAEPIYHFALEHNLWLMIHGARPFGGRWNDGGDIQEFIYP